jgi:hypothetical protein
MMRLPETTLAILVRNRLYFLPVMSVSINHTDLEG